MTIIRSAEWREKQRIAHLGKINGSKNPMFGKTHSIEAREKIRLAQLGKKESEETKKKLSLMRRGINASMYGKHHSEETKNKIRLSRLGKSFNANEKHYMWKGDRVGYGALHAWLRRHYGVPTICEQCGSSRFVEYANKAGAYKRDREDWLILCKSCHNKFDKNSKNMRISRYGSI